MTDEQRAERIRRAVAWRLRAAEVLAAGLVVNFAAVLVWQHL